MHGGSVDLPVTRVLMTLDAVGGVWRYAVDLADTLGARGIDCLLVGFGPEPSAEQRAACARMTRASLVWTDAPLDWMAPDETALEPVAPMIARLAREFRADLLHLNLPSQAIGIAAHVPVVTATHSCLPTWFRAVRGSDVPAPLRWHRHRAAEGLRRADAVVAPSASHAAAVQRIYGALPDLHVVHNASAVAPVERPDKQDFVFAVGRWWDPAKNADTLDAAAAATVWPVLAAGPLHGADGGGVSFGAVRALGALPSEEVLALMRRAAVFAAPSRYEPFGLAVLEAALSCAALVLADIPTFREMWDGAALFVPPDDPAAWTRTLNELAAAPERRRSLGALAKASAQSFTPRRQADAMLAIYAGAMARSANDAKVSA